jgi:hypothetical protein
MIVLLMLLGGDNFSARIGSKIMISSKTVSSADSCIRARLQP